MARQMAGRLPEAMQATKQLLNQAQSASEAEVLLAESALQQALLGSPGQLAWLRAGFKPR